MAKKKKKLRRVSNSAEQRQQQVNKANQTMQKAWSLIYQSEPEAQRRLLEDCDASYSPVLQEKPASL